MTDCNPQCDTCSSLQRKFTDAQARGDKQRAAVMLSLYQGHLDAHKHVQPQGEAVVEWRDAVWSVRQ